MLRFLFPRLTPAPPRGQLLFDAAVAEARQPHWYVDCGVPDSIDGRFAMLTTICALLCVRLEASGADGDSQSAALTERFVEAMDAEHRQLGLNDPTLGKRVRKMVGALARKVGTWRAAVRGGDWQDIVRSSVYGSQPAGTEQLACAKTALKSLWARLLASSDEQITQGKF